MVERSTGAPEGAGARLQRAASPATAGTAEQWWEVTGALGSEPIVLSGAPTAAGLAGPRALGGAGGEGAQKLMSSTLRTRRLRRGMGGAAPHSF